MAQNPQIIQGGMGAGVSSWRLARAVSSLGQLGVVSGVALDVILARRLQDGDRDGSVRSALAHFPVPAIARRILDRYFIEDGKRPDEPYAPVPMHSTREPRELTELAIAGNFVEVFLARIGHSGDVGINYLEKIQLPHLASIYGAMLAGVAVVIMGAGIALRVPGVLDRLANHEPASYPITVTGELPGESTEMQFDPREFLAEHPPLQRPRFFSIVSSNVLATTMVRRSNGTVDGFIVEGPTAGGHNAPPRGAMKLDELGQPVYGDKDSVDLAKLAELGKPFWLAGGYATPERYAEARAAGAAGVQIGTAFALCEESGLAEPYRNALVASALGRDATVFTDPSASPTGFPFKVANLEGSLADSDVYSSRERVCDLGFLREAYRTASGSIGWRCAAEPPDNYAAKGGNVDDTAGRKCLCNALVSNIGQPQLRRDGRAEPPLVTAGDDLLGIARFVGEGLTTYTAEDVVRHVLG